MIARSALRICSSDYSKSVHYAVVYELIGIEIVSIVSLATCPSVLSAYAIEWCLMALCIPGLVIVTPWHLNLWAHNIISHCWVDNWGTSAFPCTIPPILRSPSTCWYDPSNSPIKVSIFRFNTAIVAPIDIIIGFDTAYLVALIAVISGYILLKCAVISCC